MEGQVAETLIATSSKYGGVLTKEDLAAYRPTWREPMHFEAFGWQLAGADLPSSGGILVSASTWMMEAGKIGDTEPLSADRVHLQAECWRRAFADRYLLGDPQTTLARSADLTDPQWLAKRWQSFDPKTATPSDKVQLWSDVRGRAKESSDTTEISVVDKDGNAVAITTTLNGLFGGALWVPGFGFLNNEMDDFAASVTEANEYGLIQGEANVVGPGKKMLSSMSPTVAWKASPEGEEILVLGGRGGSHIPTGVMQVFLAVAVDGAGLQAALDRSRVHHQWLPDLISYEAGALSPETRAELERRGHALQARDHIAQVQAVRLRADGTFEAGGDPRGGGGSGGVVSPVD
jgi:gamma-glutamyltranspeptidase/glutathione hydrolase